MAVWMLADLDAQGRRLAYERRMIALQRAYPETPPGKAADLDVRELALREREHALAHQRSELAEFSSSFEIAPSACVGREDELASLEASFHEGARIVVISGIGGVGKSALARAYAERHRASYDEVLYLSAEPSLRRVFEDDSFLRFSGPPYSSRRYRSRRQYARQKMDALGRLVARTRCLVVLDDVAGAEEELCDVCAFAADFLITTRCSAAELFGGKGDGEGDGAFAWEELALGGLTAASCEEFYHASLHALSTDQGNWAGDDTSLFLERFSAFAASTLYHPLSMELWLKSQIAGNDGADTACQQLGKDEAGFVSLPTDMLRSLDARERKVLLWLSLLSEVGVRRSWFSELCACDDELLGKLEARALVWTSNGADGSLASTYIGVHPVVRRYVLDASDLSIRRMRDLIFRLADDVGDAWNDPRELNRTKEAAVLCVLAAYPPTYAWMAEAYDKLITFLWIEEYYDEAERYALQLYEATQAYYGHPHQMCAFVQLRVAAVYFNSRRYGEARGWYGRALEELNECEPLNARYDELRVMALYKNARELQHAQSYDAAWELLEEAIRLAERKATRSNGSYWQLELTYLYRRAASLWLKRDRSLAESYRKQMHEAASYLMDDPDANAIRLADIAEVDTLFLREDGRLEEEVRLLEENLSTYRRYRGELHEDTLHAQELLADALCHAGEIARAEELLDSVLAALDEHYPEEHAWRDSVRAKLGKLGDA